MHVFALQHYITVLSSLVVFPLVVASVLCVGRDWEAMSEITGTILFVTGIATLLQCLVGCRRVLLHHLNLVVECRPIVSVADRGAGEGCSLQHLQFFRASKKIRAVTTNNNIFCRE